LGFTHSNEKKEITKRWMGRKSFSRFGNLQMSVIPESPQTWTCHDIPKYTRICTTVMADGQENTVRVAYCSLEISA
jgi:hypothetical protein